MSKFLAIAALISGIVGLLGDSMNILLGGVIVALVSITFAITDKK